MYFIVHTRTRFSADHVSVQTVRGTTERSCVVYFPFQKRRKSSREVCMLSSYCTVYSTFLVMSFRPADCGHVTLFARQPYGRCKYVMFRSTEQYSWPMTSNYDLRNLPNYALPIRVKRIKPPACPRHDFTFHAKIHIPAKPSQSYALKMHTCDRHAMHRRPSRPCSAVSRYLQSWAAWAASPLR